MKMSNKIFENHQMLSMDRMQVKDHILEEKKQKKLMDIKVDNKIVKCWIRLEHTRTIDDKYYKITQFNFVKNDVIFTGRTLVETKMTEDEFKRFVEDWKKMWNLEILICPNIDQEIETFQQ